MSDIDNGIYDRYGALWWEDDGCGAMASIRFLANPPRFAFFKEVACSLCGKSLSGSPFLDVGCGGGFLAEEFSAEGLKVTGIDASHNSLVAAHLHQGQRFGGMPIAYIRAWAENLPFKKDSFPIAACCDVLEHVDDPGRVIGEIARVLKPGGLFFYETINRTAISWLMTVKAMQEWKGTAFVPPRVHRWHSFIKPRELKGLMARHDLHHREIRGLAPGPDMLANFINLRRLARGKIGYRQLAERLRFHLTRDTSNVYIGYAIKGASVAPSLSEAQ